MEQAKLKERTRGEIKKERLVIKKGIKSFRKKGKEKKKELIFNSSG